MKATLLLLLVFAGTPAVENTHEQELVAIARDLPHLCAGRALVGDWSGCDGFRQHPAVATPHDRAGAKLNAMKIGADELRRSLQHSDPKVRTLALIRLMSMGDPKVLPDVAALLTDEAQTFPHPEPWHVSDIAQPSGPQTVAEVAKAAVSLYVRDPTPEGFAEYWAEHGHRDWSANWFAARLSQASGRQLPPAKGSRERIQPIRVEIDALPPETRAWLLLYFSEVNDFEGAELLATDEERLAAARRIDAVTFMEFLGGGNPSGDPDIPERYPIIARFILEHATDLLRPGDAPALLALEETHGEELWGRSELWAVAASRLAGGKPELLREAIARFDEDYEVRPRVAAAHELWRLTDGADRSVIDLYFDGGDVFDQQMTLRRIAAENDRRLFAALVQDPHFASVGEHVRNEAVTLAGKLDVQIGKPGQP